MMLDVRLAELLQLGRSCPVGNFDLVSKGDRIGGSLASVRHDVERIEVGDTCGGASAGSFWTSC